MTDPTGPASEHVLDDLAIYALDALVDTERQAIDEHLAGCPTCRTELAEHHETLATLGPVEAPPAAIWERIATEIGAPTLSDPHRPTASASRNGLTSTEDQPPVVPAAGASVASLDTARARRRLSLGWAAAAACLVVTTIVGGAVGFALGDSSGDADIDGLAEQAASDPDGVLATLADATGQPVARVVADEDGAYMVLEGLQDLSEGRAYQLWSLTGPEPVSLGMLGRYGSNTVAFRLPPTITELAISVEQTSGEPAPTGDFQAAGTISDPA